jgi:uncharacterized protein (TIGR02284 family)
MIKTDDTSLAVLNTLLAICHDSQQGYEVAATDVQDPELSRLLGELGAQRMKFGDELAERVRTLRGEPRKSGTMAGEVHRAWIDFKAANARPQAHEILAECERAEDIATAAYRGALKTPDVDEITLKLIQRQYEQVQLAHDRVRDLRDSPAYAYR